MTHRSLNLAVVLAAISLGAFAGCYTKLMPFRDAIETRRASVSHNAAGNFTADVNYRDNCLSCHSEAELIDRAADMNDAGIHTVHGLTYDPYGWKDTYSAPPWWEPYIPPTIGVVAGPNLQPVLTKNPSGAKPATATSSNAERRRATGTTRGTTGTREANPTGSVTPTMPTSSTPAAPASGSGAVTTTPSAPPAQTSAPASDTRTRSTGTEETKTRKTGSGR